MTKSKRLKYKGAEGTNARHVAYNSVHQEAFIFSRDPFLNLHLPLLLDMVIDNRCSR